MARPCMAGTEQSGYSDRLAPPIWPVSLAVSSTVPLSSLSAARALRRSPVPSPRQVSPGLLPEALELRQEAVSMIRLLRFPSLEHDRRHVALAGAGTRREGSLRNAPLRPCKEYQRPGLGCCGLAQMVQVLGIRSPGTATIAHFTSRMALGSYSD